jgi:hypothetical protein
MLQDESTKKRFKKPPLPVYLMVREQQYAGKRAQGDAAMRQPLDY